MFALLPNLVVFLIHYGLLFAALTIHEFSHALVADRLGDPTPRLQGRLTLNPLKHLDPIGTLALIFTSFGWGKPVQIDTYNLKNPVKDHALIALAGPVSNFSFALLLAIIFRIILSFVPALDNVLLLEVIAQGIILNLSLALFNLIPVFPLDGGSILRGLLPESLGDELQQFTQRYGFFILLMMILPLSGGRSLVSQLLTPSLRLLASLLIPS